MSEPTLSVLVPVHNWLIAPFLRSLAQQSRAPLCAGRVEIHLVDDATPDPAVRAANRAAVAALLPEMGSALTYHESQENLGRARARNAIALTGRGRFLLFLDCDVMPDAPDFLATYLRAIDGGSGDVLCGGISYRQRTMHGRPYEFYRYVSSRNEAIPAQQRMRTPWRYLLTGNIAVEREIFAAVKFDERFRTHGYEDVEWGIRLSRSCRVLHLDNTVSHLGLIERSRFVERTRAGIPNLALLARAHPDAINQTPIWRWVRALQRVPLWAVRSGEALLHMLLKTPLLPHQVRYLVFQIDKAFLLTRVLARTDGPVASADRLAESK